ncbi:RNHCP domain-containing protein [Nitrolancea hollandica]|uniref:RNHCP domain-containing protein n=1 Tax=Nitrolancea hollandica Lb TaxID=1129897 RepID=I4EIL2_9BACT|nr:RNHCP domain-containing protein [Nitrolancea hollandica]CCF84524.1 hypothetical protein NITHO_3530005 [Nitrolancea hollandica Lb]
MAHKRARMYVEDNEYRVRGGDRERKQGVSSRSRKKKQPEPRRHRRPGEDETFRCRACKRMVGPALSGGRHRNHCPVCLHSRHVDGKTPGDRASDCRSLMAPVGLFARPTGEQVIIHRCLGCGFERYNRIAADDNPLTIMQLPLVDPGFRRTGEPEASSA